MLCGKEKNADRQMKRRHGAPSSLWTLHPLLKHCLHKTCLLGSDGGGPRSWREDVCLCINTCGEDLENFTSFYKLVSLSPHMLYTCNNGMERWMGIVYLKKIKSLVVQNSPSYFENLRRISRSNWWLSKKSENPPPKINNNRPSTFTPQLHLLGSRPCLGYNDSPV